MQEPAFRRATAARWMELRQGPLNNSFFIDTMQTAVTQTLPAVNRNYQKWTVQLASPFFPTYMDNYAYQVQKLLNWALARASWMDAALMDAASGGLGNAPGWKSANTSRTVTASARNL